MQREFNRGNGFIISPVSTPFVTKKPEKKPDAAKTKNFSHIEESAESVFSQITTEWKKVKKAILSSIISLSAVVGCAMFFSNFFIVGTAVYKGNELIAFSYSEEDYLKALSLAKEHALGYNIKDNELNFRVTPSITFKDNIIKKDQLKETLLINTDSFRYGCTLYSENTPVFSVENEETAKEIVKEYVSSYSMNGQADVGVKLTYKKGVIPLSKISDREKCLSLLSESVLPVVSVVNTSQEKEIPFETQTQYDENMYVGEQVTIIEGKPGSLRVEEETVYKNGLAEYDRVISESITVQPVTRVVKVGTKPKDVLQSGLLYPLTGRLSSPFGTRWGRMHEGIDIAVPVGTLVKAAECGTVIYAGDGGGYGNFIKIDHGNGVVTAYAHLDKIIVSKGQTVDSDTVIAESGNTGRSTGPHLHFEVLKNQTPLDPLTYLKKR